jgi:hypothetical protein
MFSLAVSSPKAAPPGRGRAAACPPDSSDTRSWVCSPDGLDLARRSGVTEGLCRRSARRAALAIAKRPAAQTEAAVSPIRCPTGADRLGPTIVKRARSTTLLFCAVALPMPHNRRQGPEPHRNAPSTEASFCSPCCTLSIGPMYRRAQSNPMLTQIRLYITNLSKFERKPVSASSGALERSMRDDR